MAKHILIFSQYFYPEQFRINDIAKELVNRGYQVSVVTGIPNYPEGRFYDGYGYKSKRKENWNGIDIYRIPIIPRGKNSIQLVLNYYSFVISGRLMKKRLPNDFDVVFTYEVSPITQALPAINIAKAYNKPHLIYVMDLWPDNVTAITGLKNKPIINYLNKMVDYIYDNSDKVLTSSKSFARSIESRGVEKDKLMYWPQYAEDIYEVKDPENKEVSLPKFSERSFVFAGNIGEAQGLEILPLAAEILKKKNYQVKFVIIGDGRFKSQLEHLIKEKKVEDFFYLVDRQPAEKIPYYLAKVDVGLITLNSNPIFTKTIPAKLQSLMASGMPLLVSANGEIQDIVKASGSGFVGDAGDVDTLVDNIIKFTKLSDNELNKMSENSLTYTQENFDKDKLIDELAELLEESNV